MSSSMTPMEVGILLVQFSGVPDSERPRFLRQHPEIRSAWVVDWALTAARLRGQMGEPEAKTRLARAALYIAMELGDHERQAAAQEILAEQSDQGREPRTLGMGAVVDEEPSLPAEQITIRTSDDRTMRRIPPHTKAAFTFEVFDLLSAVASAGGEGTARQVVRSWIRMALQSEFLPALMQIHDMYSRSPGPALNLDALCALILGEVGQTLAEMDPHAVGLGGACTALHLADSPQALEAAISRYRPLINDALYDELERMSESFEARGLPDFAAQSRLLANLIREHVSASDEGLGSLTLDPQTLALLRVSLANTEEEAWAAVEEEPGLLSNEAIQQIRAQAVFQELHGDPVGAVRLQQVADWLARWRGELVDPECNIVSRLADQVRAGELTLDAAIAELQEPGALARLSVPHLGAIDECVMELKVRDLPRAETLAVLNDAAARQVGGAKICAYTALSLAELRILRGATREALQVLEEVMGQAQGAADPRLELRILSAKGMAYQQLGRLQEAVKSFRDAQNLVRRIGSDADQMPCLDNLGCIYGVLGDTEQAFACVQEGYEIACRLGDRHSEAKFLGTMATLSQQTGRFHEAVEQFAQAIEIFHEAGDVDSEARALGNLGQVYVDLGESQKAKESIERSLALARSMGMRSTEMTAWHSLGEIELRQGRIQQAIEHLQQSLAIAMEIGDRRTEAISQNNLGVIHTRLNQWDQAGRYLEKAHDIARQIGDRQLEGSASLNLGNNYGSQGLWSWAMDHYQATLNIAQELGDWHLEAQALLSLGRSYEQQGYFQAALTAYERSLKLQRKRGDRQGEAVILSNMASSYAGLGHFEQAIVLYNQALSIARDLENPEHIARILAGRGHTYTQMGFYAEACDDYRESIQHIEDIRGSLLEEEYRISYFDWAKMAVYRSLVLLLATQDRGANSLEALEVMERSKSRAFLEQLGYAIPDQVTGQAPEYVIALQQGKPASWEELRECLRLT